MRITHSKVRNVLLAAASAIALAACSGGPGKNFQYTEIHEIPPGPGIVSGEDGEVTVFERNLDKDFSDASSDEPESSSGSGGGGGGGGSSG